MELSFNASTVAPAENNFEPIPAGWYQMVVEKAELKPTKAGTGSMISLQCKVQGPTHANRVVFGNINYQNPSEQAQEIGQRQLSALCHSIDVLNLTNVQQLIGRPFEARVKITAATYNIDGKPESGIKYEPRNELQGFRAVGAATASAPGTATAPTAPSAPQQPQAPAAVQQPTAVQQPAAVAQAVEQPAQAAAATEQPKQPW